MKITEAANTTEELKTILSRITFVKSCINFDWNWEIEEIFKEDGKFLRGWLVNTTFRRPDINTGEIGTGKGRQLLIEKGWSKSAIFFTCWVACDLIVRHELMEAIRWDGKRVLNPHHNLDELALPDKLKEFGLSPEQAIHLLGNSL